MISLCHSNNISMNVQPDKINEIIGGNITIQSILGQEFHKKHICAQLRNRSIIFLDQITTQDGKMLNNWYVATKKSFNDNVASNKTLLWFKLIQQATIQTADGNRLLKNQYITSQATHLKGAQVNII